MSPRRLTNGQAGSGHPVPGDGKNESIERDTYHATFALVRFALETGHSEEIIRSELIQGLHSSAGWFDGNQQKTMIDSVQRAIDDALAAVPPPQKKGKPRKAIKK
jgi:hypothetical protein